MLSLSGLKLQFHYDLIFIPVDFYESETLIEILGGIVAFYVAQDSFAVFSILLHWADGYGFRASPGEGEKPAAQHRLRCA